MSFWDTPTTEPQTQPVAKAGGLFNIPSPFTPTANSTQAIPDASTLNISPKSFWDFAVKEVTPRKEPVQVRRPFEATPIDTTLPPIVTQAASFGTGPAEALPRAGVTLAGEAVGLGRALKGQQPGTVDLGFDMRRLGYDTPEYQTAAQEIQDAINKGENPWQAGLRVIFTKALDVALGAQLFSGIAKILTAKLLAGNLESKVIAQDIVDGYKARQSATFEQLKDASLPVREKALADLANAKTEAEKVIAKHGAPTTADRARVTASRYTEPLARETPIVKDIFAPTKVEVGSYPSRMAQPDISMKPVTGGGFWDTPIAGLLPGERPLGGKTPQPAFGLSIQPVEKVGGEAPQVIAERMAKELKPVNEIAGELYQGGHGLTQKEATRIATEAVTVKVVPTPSPLVTEARKYKTAEEFVYHTTPAENVLSIQKTGLKAGGGQFGEGTYFTSNEELLKTFSKDFDVQIRVNKDMASRFGGFTENQTKYRDAKELLLSNKDIPIPSKVLEIKTKDGSWIPLDKANTKDFTNLVNVYRAKPLKEWWNKNYDNLTQQENDTIGRIMHSNGESGSPSNAKLVLKPSEKVQLDKLTKNELTDIWSKAQTPSLGTKTSRVSQGKAVDSFMKTVSTDGGGFGLGRPPIKKPLSEVDQFIAQNKIRVVSRDGRDVYQTKQGDTWVNARDESSAVTKVTRIKPKAELPPALEQEKLRLEMKKEVLDSNPAKGLGKLVTKRGEFAGGFTEVGGKGTGKWAKEGDQIANDLGYADSEEARVAYADYQAEVATLKDQKSWLKDQIKKYKIQQATEERVTKEKGIAPVSEIAKTEIPQIKGTGEARTLEKTAQEQLSREGQVGSPDIWPLDKMIVTLPSTPLKAKVNMLDYIRTPDKVLQKIGLGKEAEIMRVGYEGYLKELPKNIDKITAWSKEVPKDANQRIFRWLDGEAIDLAQNELKVGEEIKTWLSEWANRLGLPEDNRIAEYITHIFDDQLLKKEFDEDIAKIIADKIPGTVYDPFLQKRLGAQGYKQDTWAALDAYVKRATRKVHMDPALTVLEEAAGGLEKSQWDYVKNYVDRVNMRPTDIDNLLDNGIKQIIGYRFGQRPTLAVTRVLRQATYRAMIGGNVGSALRNLSQGMNTYAKLGEKYTAIGYVKLMQSGAQAELEKEGVLLESFIQDRAISSTKKAIEKADKALFYMFQGVEHINRGSAYFGAKAKALAEGKTEAQAIEYGKKIVRDTQFVFGSIDTPLILSSDIAKTLGQFQTFSVKQTEFLIEMAKNKEFAGLIRYVIAGLAFTYTIGKAFGMDPSEIIPFSSVFTGKNSLFQSPPSLRFPIEAGKAILNVPDQYGRPRDLSKKVSDVGKTLWGLVPAGIQIKKTIEGSQTVTEGGVKNKLGRLQFKTGDTLAAKAQAVTFGKYASPQAQDYFAGISRAERLYKELKKLPPAEANARLDALETEDPALSNQLDNLMKDIKLGITPEDKTIRAMGVVDGSRAQYIYDKAMKMKTTEERNAYLDDLTNKKIISDKVDEQIGELISRHNTTP